MSKRHDKQPDAAKVPTRGELTAQLAQLEKESAEFVAQAQRQIAYFGGRMDALKAMLGIVEQPKPLPTAPPEGAKVLPPASPKKLKQMLKNGAAKVATPAPAQE